MRSPVFHGPRQVRGVGLIEVMIAVLLVSIGALAAGALFARTLASNTSAMSRSLVVIQGESLFDALRVDRAAARQGAYNTTVKGNACPTAAADMPSQRLHAWCTRLGLDLGATAQTQGTVACLPSGECAITIVFDDSRAGPGGSLQQTVVTRGIL